MRYGVIGAVSFFGILVLTVGGALAADPQIDKLLVSPVGKDWVTNGGNMTNQRYSTLKQINGAVYVEP